MADIENSPWFADAKEAGRPVVKDPPKFDLESYIANYEGPTKLQRLFLIGSTSTYLSLEALRTAITLAKQGKDVTLYQDAVERLHSICPDDSMAVLDTAWCDRRTREIKAEQENLESQLKGYKNNLIKESIRMGLDDLGQFYTSMGDHSNAMKSFARERDYCTTSQHIADMSLKLILTGINQNNWTTVNSNLAKIHPMNLKPEDRAKLNPICAAVMGLSQLATGNYREAARHFLSVSPSFLTAEPQAGIHWQKQVLTANDIAVYGGLCALASMDRAELQCHVLDNHEFRQFLELEPHIRRTVSLFCGSKYTAALEILEAYRTDYLLDVYLQIHVKELYGCVRSKSIVQYFIPFSCVTLDEMSRAFASSDDVSVEDELVDMIQRGILDARIDLVERLLIAPPTNPRATAHAAALKMAQDYERTLRLRLVRLAMLDAGLVLKAPKGHLSGQQQSQELMGGAGGFESGFVDSDQMSLMEGPGRAPRPMGSGVANLMGAFERLRDNTK